MTVEVFPQGIAGKRLLWIDDRASEHQHLMYCIKEHGVDVIAVGSVNEALNTLATEKVDKILLDAMLGHDSSLSSIPEILDASDGASLSIFSGFMYRDFLQVERQAAEERTGVKIETIDKTTLPDAHDEHELLMFVRNILEGDDRESDMGTALITEATPLTLSFGDHARLTIEEKMAWLDLAEPLIREAADNYFADGYSYLLFCGSADKPKLSYERPEDIPSEEEVMAYSKAMGFAPVAIHNVGTVDDVSGGCCERQGLRSYPTLTVSAIKDELVDVHFDNGASQSLMSYEWYGEKGWIPYSRQVDLLRVGEMTLKGARYTLPDCEFIDADGTRARANFKAYYIMRWDACRLAVPCGPTCTNPWRLVSKSQRLCRFRTGLLGRTLPRDELRMSFTVDFSSGAISFGGARP